MDAGTRGNAWTLATAGATGEGDARRTVIGGCWEWKGSKSAPLSPKGVFREVAAILIPQGIKRIRCDAWSFDANQDHARDVGLELVQFPSGDVQAAYGRLRSLLTSGSLTLPPVP